MTPDAEKSRERRENGSAWFAVLTGAVIGAVGLAWFFASRPTSSSSMDVPVGAAIGGLIFGFVFGGVIGGTVGFWLWRLWRARRD